MNIELTEIKKIFDIIINKMEHDNITKINIDFDLYWHIPTDSIYDVYNTPKELDMGQLSEDYELLISLMNENILTIGSLRKLSSILRYIADNQSLST